MDDIVVIVADSFEDLAAIAAQRGYHILYRRTFDAVRLDALAAGAGQIAFPGAGALAVANRLAP